MPSFVGATAVAAKRASRHPDACASLTIAARTGGPQSDRWPTTGIACGVRDSVGGPPGARTRNRRIKRSKVGSVPREDTSVSPRLCWPALTAVSVIGGRRRWRMGAKWVPWWSRAAGAGQSRTAARFETARDSTEQPVGVILMATSGLGYWTGNGPHAASEATTVLARPKG